MKSRCLLACAAVGSLAAAFSSAVVNAQSSTETYSYDALGRLVTAVTSGGQNNNAAHSICYDDAGNRTDYVSDGSGGAAVCAGGSPPPPPPSNQPPVPTDDTVSTLCGTTVIADIVANDTDPDGNNPLSIVSLTWVSGYTATVTIYNSTSVQVTADAKGPTFFTYVVKDSLGATATGNLTARGTGTLSYCGGI